MERLFHIIYWQLYLPTRFFIVLGTLIVLFIIAFLVPGLYPFVRIGMWAFLALVAIDYVFLYFLNRPPTAKRIMAERLSNGDENSIELLIRNRASFPVEMDIIDELPVQFQKRDWNLRTRFSPNEQKQVLYQLRPVERGEYEFGRIILYVRSLLGLLRRRYNIEAEQTVAVYPSYMQLRNYALLSGATIQSEQGSRRMRKIGHSMEFEQIKEYVRGDDIRTINWKATARLENKKNLLKTERLKE